MSMPDSTHRYTYGDIAAWDTNMRWEIIQGTPYAMAPAPSPEHQDVSEALEDQLRRVCQ